MNDREEINNKDAEAEAPRISLQTPMKPKLAMDAENLDTFVNTAHNDREPTEIVPLIPTTLRDPLLHFLQILLHPVASPSAMM